MILRNRSLVALMSAEVVSGLGTRMTFLALPWFVLVTTGSPAKMGFVLAAELVPMVVLGIPSGSLLARFGARRSMLAADLIRVPIMASIPLLHSAGVLSFPLLLVLVAAFGVFGAPYFAAQRVILPEILGSDERTIAQANSVIEGATMTSGLLGPPLAGVLIPVIGAANVLFVDAGTFLYSFLAVLLLVSRRAHVRPEEPGGVLDGLRFMLRDAFLGPLSVVIVAFNALGQMLLAGLPVLAFQRYHSAHAGGWLFAAFGFGGLVGTIFAFRLVTKLDPLKLASAAVLILSVPIWVLVARVPLALALVAIAVSAFGGPLINAPVLGMLTTRTPQYVLPKLMTAVTTLAVAGGPLAVIGAGFLMQHVGLSANFAVVAAGWTLTSLLFIALIARFRRREAEAPVSGLLPSARRAAR